MTIIHEIVFETLRLMTPSLTQKELPLVLLFLNNQEAARCVPSGTCLLDESPGS
jgi:hypothetical protein